MTGERVQRRLAPIHNAFKAPAILPMQLVGALSVAIPEASFDKDGEHFIARMP